MSEKSTESTWKLTKYARHVTQTLDEPGAKSSKSDKDWEMYDGDTKELMLSITSSLHLIVMHGNTIQENYFLWNAKDWIRGISKGDSMLFVVKLQNACRRFRIKFSSHSSRSGAEVCQSCASCLDRHFPIRRVQVTDQALSKDLGTAEVPYTLEDTVPLTTVAQVMRGQLKATLPMAYQSVSMTEEQLSTMVRLCLTDSSFPQFVGLVEAAIDKVLKEDTPSSGEV